MFLPTCLSLSCCVISSIYYIENEITRAEEIENNTWMCENMKFISSADQDILLPHKIEQ